MHKFPLKWYKAEGLPAPGIEYHGHKVFGTFICGGGSSFGYKLAGYNHLGGIEIDPSIAEVYRANHKPKHLFVEDIRASIKRADLPNDLHDLDLLDGSPPCSTFSMAGDREDSWGKEKVFAEGQALQRLDDLFYDYIDLAAKLQPKGLVAENVKGMILGNAKAYVKDIKKAFERIGYDVQIFLLNAASMGVPQRRERIFFICRRKDLGLPPIKMNFNEPVIKLADIEPLVSNMLGEPLTDAFRVWWEKTRPGDSFATVHPKGIFFNSFRLAKNRVCPTVTSTEAGKLSHYKYPHVISDEAMALVSTFPVDYDYLGKNAHFLMGMSVPPIMTAQIAHKIYEQWFKINNLARNN